MKPWYLIPAAYATLITLTTITAAIAEHRRRQHLAAQLIEDTENYLKQNT